MTHRRKLLQTLGWIGSAAAAACGLSNRSALESPSEESAVSEPVVKWQLAASWPESLDLLFGGAQFLCDRVATITNGQFQITPSPANVLAPALEVIDAVMAGTVECGHTGSHYGFNKSPALAFMSGLPFGLNTQQQNAWLYRGDGLTSLEGIYRELGLVHFPVANTGAQMGGWFTAPVNTLEDLQGLRMRIVGMGGQVMERLGATVQRLGADDIVPALASGQIDAAEWIGPYDDKRLGLHKVASYYYYPGWWTPSEAIDLMINRQAWDALPRRFQVALKLAAAEANLTVMNRYTVANARALRTLLDQGVQLQSFDSELLAIAQQTAFDLYAEIAANDSAFARIYTQWQGFRDRVVQWNSINELSFAATVFAQPEL